MKIKEVTTTYIENSPFSSFVKVEDDDFSPHFNCEIATDEGTFRGNGETKEVAHKNAVKTMKFRQEQKITDAINEYNAKQGVYFVDC